jgi:hypothetical protein
MTKSQSEKALVIGLNHAHHKGQIQEQHVPEQVASVGPVALAVGKR